jgi:hypothetical protein
VFDGGSGEILALTCDDAGTIYLGTTPDGKVYRIIPGGKPELFCSTGETYIFALLSAPTARPSSPAPLYAATGEHGKLLSISSTGKATELFTAPQAHLTALAWLVPGKELLVGTSPDGIVYRLALEHSGTGALPVSVLYDTPLNEVRSIAADGTGRVYIGANASGDGGSDSSTAAVYFIDRDGVRRWSWPCPDSTVFALSLAPGPSPLAPRPSVLVATGTKAMVYELDTLGRVSVRYRLKETQALCLTPQGKGLWLGTGNPGKLYEAGAVFADSGYITSPPHDCTSPARFGTLTYRAKAPAGTAISFETRSGNSDKPDSTWSQWSIAAPGITSPSRRFIQWRCRFRTSFPNLTPELSRVDVYFRSANLAPATRKLDIAGPSLEDAKKGTNKPSRSITWEATDPDSDSLSFELYFRRENEGSWQKLGRDITDSRYDLDTRALPDGWYEVKLVASDEPTEAAGAALKSEQTSRPFLVDNTAPTITDLRSSPSTPSRLSTPDSRLYRVSFSVQDALSPIAAARVAVNAGDWITLGPEDGIFDSSSERFAVEVKLSPGENAIAVWAADAQGNVAAARTTISSR